MSIEKLLNRKSKNNLRVSTIQKMMALSRKEGVISFTAGEPSADQYPIDSLAETSERVFKEYGEQLLGYIGSHGIGSFKEFIREWMISAKDLPESIGPESIIPTNGSQEGINLLSEVFMEEGDTVLTEIPTYPEALLVFYKEGANIIGIQTDEHGMVPKAAEEYIKNHRRVKFIYVIPTFQNPTGYTMTEKRKKELLKIAEKYNLIIIEDDPYGKLRYEGTGSPSILYHDGGKRVIYLSTFSKLIAPGLRIGWMVVPSSVLKEFLLSKGIMEIGLPSFIQQMVVELAKNGYFKKELPEIVGKYKKRRDIMEDNLHKYIQPLGASWKKPDGGFFYWLKIEWMEDSYNFCFEAVKKHKVGLVPGITFYPPNIQEKNYIRLSFSKVKDEEIEEGIKRFANALKDYRG